MVSSDDFCNADVRYEQSFANIRASLTRSNGGFPEIPIVTGFLARGENTGRYLYNVHYNAQHASRGALASDNCCNYIQSHLSNCLMTMIVSKSISYWAAAAAASQHYHRIACLCFLMETCISPAGTPGTGQ